MRARVGDLAIARFDPGDDDIKAGRKWCEHVCIVTGTRSFGSGRHRDCEFIYWDRGITKNDIMKDSLPPHRLVRARPIGNAWNGTLENLTLSNVVASP